MLRPRVNWLNSPPRKQGNKKKNKSVAKEQAAQAQPVQVTRDTASKPASASSKSAEAPIKPTATAPAPRPVIQEPHVPMNGFNASEVEAMLSAGAADAGEVYKPENPTLKAGGVWGTKRETYTSDAFEGGHLLLTTCTAGAMTNGKDFWLELRKQVADVQANGVSSKAENKKQGG